jgi:hypothetical protein
MLMKEFILSCLGKLVDGGLIMHEWDIMNDSSMTIVLPQPIRAIESECCGEGCVLMMK